MTFLWSLRQSWCQSTIFSPCADDALLPCPLMTFLFDVIQCYNIRGQDTQKIKSAFFFMSPNWRRILLKEIRPTGRYYYINNLGLEQFRKVAHFYVYTYMMMYMFDFTIFLFLWKLSSFFAWNFWERNH